MGYYDIDDILAEDQQIPCTTQFDFVGLSHLDESSVAPIGSRKRKQKRDVLPEGSRLKLPLWAVEKWGELNFIRTRLPKLHCRRSREQLVSDPASADLRARGERYVQAGILVCDWTEHCMQKIAERESAPRSSGTIRSSTLSRAVNAEMQREIVELRNTLREVYTGARLRQSLDWSLSSVGQDVSHFTRRLTVLEKKLFEIGLDAAKARYEWKISGSKKIPVSKIMKRWNWSRPRVVSPESLTKENGRPAFTDAVSS
eukprot:CAMPEP_0116032256 /NCGR_PEP_ID=MMETSP0321-20121206/18050_1 /TAXON_ID=163516 /ORGANISM="Leptocylindrus danicus var. danicus, Strain B650" /LENGTH=256 /DNA_ID=CAMNT_0003507635 /DNA_START=362 /DNA_END=1132 /DNA_ORIENTATION=+